jgi:hypothetical protein
VSVEYSLGQEVVWVEFFRVGEHFRVTMHKKREDRSLCPGRKSVVLYNKYRGDNNSLELAGIQTSTPVSSTVARTKLCVPRPLEAKGKRIRRVGGVAGKEAYTVQTINIISQ